MTNFIFNILYLNFDVKIKEFQQATFRTINSDIANINF